MEIEDFYSIGSKLLSGTFQTRPVGLRDIADNTGLFDEHRLILGNYDEIELPVVFEHVSGSRLHDIIDTGWASLYLISDRINAILVDNNLTGWKSFPVKVLNKQDQEVSGYQGLSITGRCGKINYRRSKIIEKRLVPLGPIVKYYKGLHIGLDRWDGKDFFLPDKYFGIITTRRAAEILLENKITNIRLENLSEKEIDYPTVQAAISNQ